MNNYIKDNAKVKNQKAKLKIKNQKVLIQSWCNEENEYHINTINVSEALDHYYSVFDHYFLEPR